MLRFNVADPEGAAARWCLAQYYDELNRLFESGFDPAKSAVSNPREFAPPTGTFLVGSIGSRWVACGAVVLVSSNVGYIKRMWVDSSVRGRGLGRKLLEALETAAADLGCSVVQLETNRSLATAISLYRSSGFEEVPPFNDEFYAHYWFRKDLSAPKPRTVRQEIAGPDSPPTPR